MLKAIIFDFDGTIADTKDISYYVYCELAKKYNIEIIDKKAYDALSELPLRKRLSQFGVPFYKLPKLVKIAIPLFRQYLQEAPIFPELQAVLDYLKEQGYLLIILSSNHQKNINHFLELHNLNHFTDVYAKASLFGKDKKIQQLLKKHKLTKDEVVYIGDEERDILSCKKAGVKIISVPWGYDDIKLLESANPDFLIRDPEEIIAIVETLIG